MRKGIVIGVICVITLMFLCTFISCSSNENKGIEIKDLFTDKDMDNLVNASSWIVPDFYGWSCAEVTNVLDQIGQKYEVVFISDENANVNAIIGQVPDCGEKIQKNEVLQLSVNNYYAKSNAITILYSYKNPIAEIGKWIYFTDGTSIYKSYNDFKTCEKIYSLNSQEESIVSIVPRENVVFYLVKKGIECSIYSINTDGINNHKIYGPEFCVDFYTEGDKLFMLFGDMNSVCYDLTKNEMNVRDFKFQTYSYLQHDGYRYYVKAGGTEGTFSLCRYNIEDNSETILFESEKNMATDVCIFKNNIYYICYSKNNNDNILNIDEWLYKYDIDNGKNTLIKKIGFNQATADNNQLFVWAGNLIVANADRIIKVNLDNEICEEVKINRPKKIEQGSYSILCGNYIYQYMPTTDKKIFVNGRYNLLTDKYEEFDWNQCFQ